MLQVIDAHNGVAGSLRNLPGVGPGNLNRVSGHKPFYDATALIIIRPNNSGR